LDTKKSQNHDVQYLIPELLDLIAFNLGKGKKKSVSVTSYEVNAPDLIEYNGVSLNLHFTLLKSHVVALGSADSTAMGLEFFCRTRDKEERKQRQEAEAERQREEEDRKRRAAWKAREDAAWEKRKEQARREKAEFQQMKREWAEERARASRAYDSYGEDDEDDDEECQCPKCRFNRMFGARFGFSRSSSGSAGTGFFSFNIGGIPFNVRFDFDSDNEDEDSFFDGFDERWDEQMEEEMEEENRKQADILGVPHDADARTIKLAYRKMALRYHPDKWKSDNGHGMSKMEAESCFKEMQSAYDHLMATFDD